jgi:hypothetical protein
VTGFPYSVREHTEWHVPLFQAFLVRAQAVRRGGTFSGGQAGAGQAEQVEPGRRQP